MFRSMDIRKIKHLARIRRGTKSERCWRWTQVGPNAYNIPLVIVPITFAAVVSAFLVRLA